MPKFKDTHAALQKSKAHKTSVLVHKKLAQNCV